MDVGDTLLSLFIVVVLIVSFLSNLVVLVCYVYSSDIRRQVPSIFTINLTACNLIMTLFNMPLTLAGVITQEQPFDDCLCQVLGFTETFLTTNTMLSMAALSLDRWVAVVFPLSYTTKMSYKDAAVIMSYTWIHSLCFPLVATYFKWFDYHRNYASCTMWAKDSEWLPFSTMTVVYHGTTFLLSLLVLCVTYMKVLKVARFHCKRIDVITMQTLVLLVDIHPSVKQRCLVEQKKRRQRAARKVSTFIGTFVLCFAPYVITRLVEIAPSVTVGHHWALFSRCLAYSKAALDPYVYSLLRRQYRKVWEKPLDKVLRRERHKCHAHPSSQDTENDSACQRAT
ncbi:G-protein coupled receptor 26-like [Lethenteron reissneri]|uniref:G-protein coupled receptor 26-like n=1 Tax=Lethenteron reissneri TaxID=7753 RepID=UPI002AB62B33|nr:G-protein coupled receptor 26-like [Lethenteron reissneri]